MTYGNDPITPKGEVSEAGDDMTSRIETRMQNVLGRVEERIGDLFKQVPRPIGSEPVDKIDDLEEYMLTIAQAPDPAAAFQRRIEEKMTQEGLSIEQAATWGLRWVQDNEKRVQDIAKKGRL